MQHHKLVSLLAALALALGPVKAAALAPAAAFQEAPSASINEPVPTPLLTKIHLIGASVTNGFGTDTDLKTGRRVPLKEFLSACLAERHVDAKLTGSGSSVFFMAPELSGAQQVAKALADSPSLVIAVDFLFWYGCGVGSPEKPRRLGGLKKGLTQLERFTCPIVIGTIPNVERALRGVGPFGGPLLSREQIPTELERKEMNESIQAWVSARTNVHLMDLDETFRRISAKETLEVHGAEWNVQDLGEAFLPDLLHPNTDGMVWTALTIAGAITHFEGATKEDFLFDRPAATKRFQAAVKPLQDKHAKRAAAKLERQGAREKASAKRKAGR